MNYVKKANSHKDNMIKFMRDLIKIPGVSCQEKEVVQRIKKEMDKVGFDEVNIDKMGNVIGKIGSGDTVLAMDAHIDTVDTGSLKEWDIDPFEGKLEEGVIYGRGACDQLSGMVSMVYGGKLIKELDLEDDYTLYVFGTVQEEDCDGLCWQYIINEDNIRPDCVVITEPTNLNLYRGHRGRMEIGIRTFGKSCHGSAPHRGINPVYMMSKIVNEIEIVNQNLKEDDFLGKGTVTVSYIDCSTPSLCAVPSECYIHLDRRLTRGETKESALKEIEEAVERAGIKNARVKIEVPRYDTPSYTGLKYPTQKYYPVWTLPEKHQLCRAAVNTYEDIFEKEPVVDKWTFSTNGVSTMGMFNIPTIGFGPAHEIYAHTVNEQVPVEHLVKAAAWYAKFPKDYVRLTRKEKQ